MIDFNNIWSFAITVDTDSTVFVEDDGNERIIRLKETSTLNRMADDLRKSLGYDPLFSKNMKNKTDEDAWYDFYICVRRGEDHIKDNYIGFTVENSIQDDDKEDYAIPLSDKDSREVYKAVSNDLGFPVEKLFEEWDRDYFQTINPSQIIS